MNSQTIEGRFCYWAECNLATLESLRMRKSSSRSEIRRQQSICDGMVADLLCIEGLTEYLKHAKCLRLREVVSAKMAPPVGMTCDHLYRCSEPFKGQCIYCKAQKPK